MNIDVRAWLESLGLGDYSSAFAENCIDGQVLAQLTADDLKEIGVVAVGHRRKLLDAIAALEGHKFSNVPAATELPELSAAQPSVGERRQVTVLFADLCEFTELSSTIDAEEVHAVLANYFKVADRIVRDFGGTVDKHVGDSVMAVFGAPMSHDNDPERAVRAAIAIQEAMPTVSERIGRPLQAHIGVASGEVVASGVGPDSHYTVTGDSVNLAARLTDRAQAGDVLVSAKVRHSFMGSLETTDLGEISVKGLAAPVRVYSVQGIRTTLQTDLDRPFVGRMAEIRQFKIALEVCEETARGQLIQVRGDAGIGKTRLTNEFRRLASERGFLCHRSLILDFGVGKGQDPVRTLVRSLLDVPPGDGTETRLAAVENAIAEGIVASTKKLHLTDLLDLPQSPEEKARLS